jgi:serine/threonine protein kinase
VEGHRRNPRACRRHRILPPGFARTGEILAAARAASRLSDPRLARIFDACDGDDGAYIITEWPPGDHLADLLAAGPLSCARAVTLIAEAAGALAAAHAAGVSHLCLTPRSLLWNAITGAKIVRSRG